MSRDECTSWPIVADDLPFHSVNRVSKQSTSPATLTTEVARQSAAD